MSRVPLAMDNVAGEFNLESAVFSLVVPKIDHTGKIRLRSIFQGFHV